ncbi:MAG: hypothetical protein ABI432_07740 [Flavobacteriales bacterium]
MDLHSLRTALLITLSILLVVVLLRRFRRRVLARDLPVNAHAELVRLEVAYHPPRLHVQVRVPLDEILHTSLLDTDQHHMHTWSEEPVEAGTHTIVRELPVLADGEHHFELRTTTQRTVRQFRLQQT